LKKTIFFIRLSLNDLRSKVADLVSAVSNGYNAMAKVSNHKFKINSKGFKREKLKIIFQIWAINFYWKNLYATPPLF